MVKNLVFKGGGVLGIAYAGSINVLEQKGILKSVEKVAGTSAGSIVACLLALRYTSDEIEQIIKTTDFKSFEDGINPFKILPTCGLHSGNAFLNWIRNVISRKHLSQSATFQDLKNAGCLDLHVFATDLNTQSLKRFSVEETPNVIVAEAIRASMSIPLFFQEFQFSNCIPDNHIYVDGGCIYNYPLTAFDKVGVNDETLGLFLCDLKAQPKNNGLEKGEIGRFIKALAEAVLDSQNIDLQNDTSDLMRSIMIDNLGISATNFGLDEEQKNKLYFSGQMAVSQFLNKTIK